MKEAEEQTREIETNQTRLSRLSEVSRRITESLDHGIALQEVVNGARSLADARYGVLEVFDQSGKVENSFGSGFSPGERRRTGSLPKRLDLLEYLNQNQEPLRLADVSKHPLSAGFPENHPTVKTFLGVPIRHQGEPVGNIYVTDKEGDREFAAEDEDVLVTLASQAAMAIANIRRRTGEERAKGEVEAERQRLETLVMTSPVGVLVVEVGTLNIVSANQEMARITGEVLEPGRSLAEYRPNVTSRQLDGSDIPLDEMPLNRALNKGETVRAEEVVFSLRDGPPITTLCNTTPIYSEDGEIVGAVAVIQDMTPLAEMERLRSEFLGMVSHELRIPLTAIKGSSATVLGSSAPFDDSEMLQFFRIIDEQADRLRDLVSSLLDMTRIETGMFPITPKPTDVVGLVVRRVKPTPGSQLALFASYSYHGFITDRDGETLELEADHRRHAEIENAIRDLKHGVGLNHFPSGRFPANGAWLAVQVLAHNLARWTARIGLGEGVVTTRTLRRRFFSLAGRLTRSARRLTLHLPQGWPWETQFTRALARLRALPLPA